MCLTADEVAGYSRQSVGASFDVQRFDPRTGGFDAIGEHEGSAQLALKTPTSEDYVFVVSRG